MATDEALFEGVIERAELDRGNLDMIFWVYVPTADTSTGTKRMYVNDEITITESITAAVS